jgi:hypothetical protein
MTRTTLISAAIVGLMMSAGCTIKSNEGKDGKDKVDIKTPFGSVKVDQGVNPNDTGLPLYAGAVPYEKNGGDHDAANVNISSGLFGIKVVAGEYTTPDAPDKVLDFYQKAMKTYGKVVECKGSYFRYDRKDKDSDAPVDCSDSHSDSKDEIELKVGTQSHQRVVGVRPNGSGTRFALVYVNTRGKESGS